MSETILATDHGTWVEVTLNRPERLNSFTDEMHLALRATLEGAWDNGARAILLTGAGRGFCAGQDLGDVDPAQAAEPVDLSDTIRTYYAPLIRLLRDMDMPVVCAVNGVAAGAGANIALACDIVLAGQSAKFIQSFVNVGLVPDAGGTWALTRLLGEARAKAHGRTRDIHRAGVGYTSGTGPRPSPRRRRPGQQRGPPPPKPRLVPSASEGSRGCGTEDRKPWRPPKKN